MTFGLSIFLFILGCGAGSIQTISLLPSISAVLPGTITAGTASAVLKVTGVNFSKQSVILWNGSALATALVDANTLSSTVGAPSLAQPATAQLRVQDPQTQAESQAVPVVIAASPSAPQSPSVPVTTIQPQITSTSVPAGTVGTAYTTPLVALGGVKPYAWKISNGKLPAGLTLAASTGVISGTPTVAGAFMFSVSLTDSSSPAETAGQSFSLTIAATPLTIRTTSLPAATSAVSYSTSFAAAGGTTPYKWSIASGTLPAGLQLNTSTGALVGTPSTSGTSSFTVKVTDTSSPVQTKTAALSIAVAAPVSIVTTSLPNAKAAVDYSTTLGAKGGVAPYTWSLASGTLPTGLSLSSAGIISGTSSAVGTKSLTFSVHDSANPTVVSKETLPLTVTATPLDITTTAVASGTDGTGYTQTLAATGGVSPYSWAITSGSLPAGVKLSSAGVLSGTPTVSGSFSFGVTVTDTESTAQKASSTFKLTLSAAIPPLTISTATLPAGTDGIAYSNPMAATGGTKSYTWSISAGKLPAGLTLAATTGVISGTPTTAGTSTFTAKVTDNSSPEQTASASLSIEVTAPQAPAGPGTTWFVRPDGGSRYDALAPQGQCDGKSDTAYKGSGTNQHCAFNDFRYLYDDKSYGGIFAGWVIKGGDTVIVRGCYNADDDNSGSTWCRIGTDPPNVPDTWCYGGEGAQACNAIGAIPAGTPTQHTRILGQNYAACGTATTTDRSLLTTIYGGNGIGHVFDLSGAKYVDFECFEVTRHSNCITHGVPAYPSGCNRGTDDFDSDGIATDINTSNVLMQDLWIHGHTDRGIIGPIGGPVTCNRCNISYNGMAGWDFDEGDGAPSSNGTWNISYTTIEWNGCNQEYPAVDKYPAVSCYSQSTGGYGDGVGTPAGFCMNVNIDHSTIDYNTQDGIDLGHLDTVGPSGVCTVNITNSYSYGNNGAAFKWGRGPTATVFTNNLAESNCARLSAPLAGAPSTYNKNLSDFCRAGDGMSFDFHQGSTLLMANNTFVNYAPTSFDFMCDDDVSCSKSVFTFKNNITLGFTDYPFYGTDSYGGNGAPGGFCTQACNGSTLAVGTIIRSNNIYQGVRVTCPTGDPSEFCEEPGFVGEPTANMGNFVESELDNFNFNLSATSPALKAGVFISGVPSLVTDYNGVTRPNPPAIGAIQ